MAVLYRIRKDNREGSGNKYYGKAVQLGTVDTNALAEVIQANCTVKKSDVLAVLAELVEVMTQKLQESYIVKLNGFGQFKVGIRTQGAETAEDFTAANIKGVKVNFLPEGRRQQGSHSITRTFLDGVKVQKYGA